MGDRDQRGGPGREGPLLLDAAMGTALIARGLDPARERTAAWAVSRPEEVRAVHRAHVAAGARLVLTDTFGALPPGADELAAALRLAREAGAERVALSLWAGLEPAAIAATVAAAAPAPDLIWLETGTAAQAGPALAAARGASGLPIAVTLAFVALADPAWPQALRRLAEAGAWAVGLNCSPWPHARGALAALAARAGEALAGPGPGRARLVLKPDGGGCSPDRWAEEVAAAAAAGASLVGGCCGTGPEHLAALEARLGHG